jgi:hypothetical protein
MQAYFQNETDGFVLSFPLLDSTYDRYLAAKESGLAVEEAPTIGELEALDDESLGQLYKDTLRLKSQTQGRARGILA